MITAVLLPLVLALAGAGATAQTGPAIQVVPSTVPAGQVVTVHGSGFCGSPACPRVIITLNSQVLAAAVQVAGDGTFQFPFVATQIPDQYRVTASQAAENGVTLQASYGLNIIAADVPPGQTPVIATLPPSATAAPAEPSTSLPPGSAAPSPTASSTAGASPSTTPSTAGAVKANDEGGGSVLPWVIGGVAASALLAGLAVFAVRRLGLGR